jgi:hypothetical protein
MPTLKKLPASHLKRAMSSRSVVELRRRRLDHSPIHGVVIAFSSEFVLLQKLEEGIALGGYLAVRRQQIASFTRTPEYAKFYSMALRLKRQRPKLPRGIDLSDIGSLLMSSSRSFGLVVIHQEYRDPDVCWVGIPQALRASAVLLRCVRPNGIADSEPTAFALRRITMVEFGTEYDNALRLVAEANKSLERTREG